MEGGTSHAHSNWEGHTISTHSVTLSFIPKVNWSVYTFCKQNQTSLVLFEILMFDGTNELLFLTVLRLHECCLFPIGGTCLWHCDWTRIYPVLYFLWNVIDQYKCTKRGKKLYMVENLLSWMLLHLATHWSFHGVLHGATSWHHQ